MRWRCRTKSFLARQCERNGCFATPRKGKPTNSRLIAISPDNELDYHRQLAELDSLYRNSPNRVAVLDHHNLYVRVNDTLAGFHGISPEKLTGHSPWEFLCDVAGELSVRLKQALQNNKPLRDVELTMKGAPQSLPVCAMFLRTFILWSAVKWKTGRGRRWPA